MEHFTEKEEIVFLRELKATPPFNAEDDQSRILWESIAERVSKTIGRPVNFRSLQDHLSVMKVDLERKTLIKEYIQLRETPKPAKAKHTAKVSNTKDIVLKRPRENLKPNGYSESEQGIIKTRHLLARRSKEQAFRDLIAEQIATSRISSEENMVIKRAELELDRERLAFERMKLEFKTKKHREEREFQERQYEAQQQQRHNENIINTLNLFIHLIKQKAEP